MQTTRRQVVASAAGVAGLAAPRLLRSQPRQEIPTDERIREILADRIDSQRRSVGMIAGVVEPGAVRLIMHGRTSLSGGAPVGPDTGFEIASLTKVFTALLLADAVERRRVSLADPIGRRLPEVGEPRRADGAPITLLDLATHASGLPMWPPGASPADGLPALAAYSPGRLHAYVAAFRPAPESRVWAYSNVGFGLLGQALARREGVDYGELVQHRICRPLAMLKTGTADIPPFSDGHFTDLRTAPRWTMPALAGAAELRSTGADLARFVAGCLSDTGPLAPAMRRALEVRRAGPEPQVRQALGWLVSGEPADAFVLFSGATAGFTSSVVLHPRTERGVFVLSNSAEPVGDIANHLIRPGAMLSPPRARVILALDQMRRMVGRYAVGVDAYEVRLSGGGLVVDPPDLEMAFALEAQSPTVFVAPQLGLRLEFLVENGAVTALVASRSNQTAVRTPKQD